MRAEARAVCARLQAHRFSPWLPTDGSAFADHIWSHTWINGASKVNLWDKVLLPPTRGRRGKRKGTVEL